MNVLMSSEPRRPNEAFDGNTVLLTLPGLGEQGGVASFFNGVLPWIGQSRVTPLEIGGGRAAGGRFHPILDQLRFFKAAKKLKPDLVHLNPSLSFKCLLRDGLFAWQARRMGIPVLVFWHGWDNSFEKRLNGRYRRFFDASFGKAEGFIVLASSFERTLRDWGVTAPIHRETTNVEDSLLENVDPLSKWSNPNDCTEFKILFLARLERAKGVLETVQAVKLLLRRNFPVRLTIAGDGSLRAELEQFVQNLGLSTEQVHLAGHISGEDKRRVLSTHHIYCLPSSHGEGLPTSVLEAMAFGMPVLTREIGGLADEFEDGKMGTLIEGTSAEEIADSLEALIADPAQMAAIGRYNSARAKERYMASVVATRLENIYESTIQRVHTRS
jgi:glycosyltransferase involved in cell wall biosynthesis